MRIRYDITLERTITLRQTTTVEVDADTFKDAVSEAADMCDSVVWRTKAIEEIGNTYVADYHVTPPEDDL